MMRVLSKPALIKFWTKHPKATAPLTNWYTVVKAASFSCFADVKKTYNSADQVGDHVVFNCNSFRVVATVRYQSRCIYIIHVFTHAEYDQWTQEQRKK